MNVQRVDDQRLTGPRIGVVETHHVCTLRAARLVSSRRDGKMVIYALTGDGGTSSAPRRS